MKAELHTADATLVCPSCWLVFAHDGAGACPDCAAATPAGGWPSLPVAFRGRYVLIAPIGRDAASALFLARSAGEGEPSAILEIARARGPLAASADARKLFRREATLAGLLGEETDVFLGLSSIDVSEPAYIAFEHAPWPALRDVLAEAGAPTPVAAARIGVAILRGLEALERHGLVHRALVPARIFVHRRHDGGYDVKIAGLGVWPEGEEGAALPPSADVLAYASPEQLRGEPLTSASDVHMVASVLWELVAGQVPFPLPEGASPGEAARQRLRRLARVPARPAAMPVELHELLATALHPDARERYLAGSPVAALAAALERFAEEFPARQERALGTTTRALAALSAKLAPLAALLDRKAEIEATVQRLAVEPAAPGAARAAEDALVALEADVDRLLSPAHAPVSPPVPPVSEPVSVGHSPPPPSFSPPPPSSSPPSSSPSPSPPPSPPPAFPPPSRRPPVDVQVPRAPALPSEALFPRRTSNPPESFEDDGAIPGVGGSRWPYVVGAIVVAALVIGGALLLTGSKTTAAPGASASAPHAASAPPAFSAPAPVAPAPPPASASATASSSASAPPDAGAAPRPKPRTQRARPPDEEPAAERPADPE
jgi:serine/threonine protein kinase